MDLLNFELNFQLNMKPYKVFLLKQNNKPALQTIW